MANYKILCLFLVISVFLVSFAPGNEAARKHKRRKPGAADSPHRVPSHKSKPESTSISTRVNGGTPRNSSSMVMIMESSSYYLWEYYGVGIILSDRCVIYKLTDILDDTTPPVIENFYYHTTFIPRFGCDMQYHISTFIQNDPQYNATSAANDIVLAVERRKINLGSRVCGGEPVCPSWFSCDPDGPPKGYKDCILMSYGYTSDDTSNSYATEDIEPNGAYLNIVGESECNAKKASAQPMATEEFNSADMVCATNLSGGNPRCNEDYGGALYCKYWKQPANAGWGWEGGSGWGNNSSSTGGWGNKPNSSSGWGSSSGGGWGSSSGSGWGSSSGSGWGSSSGSGWGSSSGSGWGSSSGSGWGSGSSGWGWGGPYNCHDNDWVAVGHLTYYWGASCQADSAALFIKYGSPTYSGLFSKCPDTFVCSSKLKKGYRCKGNPPASLGPVYCEPEKIPDHSGGWKRH